MPISIPGPISLLLLVYFAVRIEWFDSIWDEIEMYETKIERGLVTYMVDFFEPFHSDISERMRSLSGFEGHEVDGDNPIPVDADSLEEVTEQLEGARWEDVMANAPAPADYVSGMVDQISDALGMESDELIQGDDIERMEVRYMMENDLVDAETVFRDINRRYKQYRRFRGIVDFTKITLWVMVGVSLLLTLQSILQFPLSSDIEEIVIALVVIWLSSESVLWGVIDREVPAEGHSPLRKFLKPWLSIIESNLE